MYRDGKGVQVVLSVVVVFALVATVFFTPGPVYGQEDDGQEDEMFSDVPEDHWAYEDIKYLAEKGILTGLPSGEYEGEEAITRYQVANLVARAVRYLQEHQGTGDQQDLSTLEDLVYKLSEKVDSASQTSDQLTTRIDELQTEVDDLKARSARPENYDQLVKRSENNFILGVTGIVLGAGALAWALLIG